MEKVQIIPPPKEVDQRVLAWKGAAVLGKMDGVAELWLTAADWVRDPQIPSSRAIALLSYIRRTFSVCVG